MTYSYDGYNWLVKLNKGELLVKTLCEIVKQEDVKGAWISGLGGSAWVDLGYYDLDDKDYHFTKRDDLIEITSLQGNVAWKDNQPVLHIHGSFSDKNNLSYGGHVKELEVGGTCEVMLHRWYKPEGLTRSIDSETGLNLLDV